MKTTTFGVVAAIWLAVCTTAVCAQPASTTQPRPGDIAAQRAALAPDDIEGRLKLARWCRDKKQFAPMAALCHEVLALDPENPSGHTLLMESDGSHELQRNTFQEMNVKKEFRLRFHREFSTWYTAHFVIIFDTPTDFTARTADTLERAYETFYYFWRLKTLHPTPLHEQLVTVLFKSREDFDRYRVEKDHVNMAWMQGYYSPRSNRTTFYDLGSDPLFLKAREDYQAQLTKYEGNLKELTDAAESLKSTGPPEEAAHAAAARDKLAQAINAYRASVDSLLTDVNTCTTTHEATHQLAFNANVQTVVVPSPFWLAEGLATNFEPAGVNVRFGPIYANPMRQHSLKSVLDTPAWVPLPTLVAIASNRGLTAETAGGAYGESWSLFHFLYNKYPDKLDKLLITYKRRKPMTEISPAEHLQIFETVFGQDLAPLEKQWLAFAHQSRDRQAPTFSALPVAKTPAK